MTGYLPGQMLEQSHSQKPVTTSSLPPQKMKTHQMADITRNLEWYKQLGLEKSLAHSIPDIREVMLKILPGLEL
jgi:hypothetical protein